MTRQVPYCPECGSSRSIHHRISKGDYSCYECGSHFEKPKWEETDRAPRTSRSQRELIEADPSEYPKDDDRADREGVV